MLGIAVGQGRCLLAKSFTGCSLLVASIHRVLTTQFWRQWRMTAPAKRSCFVISPIGAEGSPVREHADEVYDFIIKPALDSCDVEAFRSDHLREP